MAQVSTSDPDSDPYNNSASRTMTILAPTCDMRLYKTFKNGSVPARGASLAIAPATRTTATAAVKR